MANVWCDVYIIVWCCFQADGGETAPVQVKVEATDDMDSTENSAAWSVLHDDFMIGARMKDWDKQTSDNIGDNMSLDSDDDDDDDSGDDEDRDDSWFYVNIQIMQTSFLTNVNARPLPKYLQQGVEWQPCS